MTTTKHEVGDAAAEVDANLRSRLDDLLVLTSAADGEAIAIDALERLGVESGEGDQATREDAERVLVEYPLCVEATMQFEIVIGTGGPDDRLIVECDLTTESHIDGDVYTPEGSYEIRRVLYRYSWTGSAERVLDGDDLATAEAFARRVVPELAE